MQLSVFRRADDRLLVAPARIPPPVLPDCTGALRTVGVAEVALHLLSDALVRELAVLGYAVPDDVEAALIRTKTVLAPAAASRMRRMAALWMG